MTIQEMMAKLVEEKKTLLAKSDLTEADIVRAEEIGAEYSRLAALQQSQEKAQAALAAIPATVVNETAAPGDTAPTTGSLGARFVKSQAYRDFRSEHPHGIGQGTPVNVKSVMGDSVSMAATLNREDLGSDEHKPFWTDDLVYRPEKTLLDLIYVGTTAESFLPYRQIITKGNNASIVGEAKTDDGTTAATGLKPISSLTTQSADGKVYDYADGAIVTNQELQDDGAMASVIDGMLRDNLYTEVERVLLNGTGTGGEPAGLLTTTGVQQQAFVTDAPTTIRKAMTKLTNIGTRIQAVVLNPEDDEAWDLLKDLEGRYLGGGPFAQGPKTAWSYARVPSAAVQVGQALLGDFSTIQLLIRSALSIEVFNQHKDYAQRNLNYVRAELRAMQLFRAPARLAVADLTAG